MQSDSQLQVVHNQDSSRFEVFIDGEHAFLDYKYYKKDIAFMHTTVPETLRGKGIASILALAGLTFAAKQHRKIMLYCPFVSKYVREHPEYHALVDAQYHPSFGKPGN